MSHAQRDDGCVARVGPAVGIRHADCDVVGSASVLSANVVFIQTPFRVPYGTRVTVLLPPVAPMGEMSVPGIVRWWNARGLGIQLDRLGPREVWAVHRLVGKNPKTGLLAARCTAGPCPGTARVATEAQRPSHP
jgi:hypothetical protein